MLAGKFKRLGALAKSAAYAVGIVHLVTYYAVDATLVGPPHAQTKGPSMSPEISESGALVFYVPQYLLSKFRGDPQPYRKNDVVISVSPVNPNKRICKRIVAVPGETIHNTTVPPGHFWLQGDNRRRRHSRLENSLDSRHYGAISSGLFQGRVFLVVSRENPCKLL